MQPRLAHRPDIDGLRGVAILALLAFDTTVRGLRGGHLGIDIFLVVSGYLLSSSILSELDRGTFDLWAYYRRRAQRILPTLLLLLIVVFAVGWFSLFALEYRELGKEVAAGATFVTNLLTWRGLGSESPLRHLWSLAIIVQFCLVWPLLLKKASPRLIAVALLLSFGMSFYWSYSHPAAAFYSPLTRAWEPMVGWAVVQVQRRGGHWDARGANSASAFGCLLLAISLALVDQGYPFPSWRALLPVVGAALILSAGPNAWVNRRILSSSLLVGLGVISYPLYLYHWPALAFANILASEAPSADVRFVILAAIILLAAASHVLIARPVRVSALLALAAATAAMGAACFLSGGLAGTGFRDPARQAFLSSLEREVAVGCTERCTERDPSKRHAVLLWGDEQTRAIYPSLKQNLPADWQVLQVTRDGCLPQMYAGGSEGGDACERFNRAAVATIAATRPDVVVVMHDRSQLVRRFVPIAAAMRELGVARSLLVGPAPRWTTGLPTLVARHFWRDTPRRTFKGLDLQMLVLDESLNRTFIANDSMAFVDVIGLFCNDDGCLTYLGDDRAAGLTSMDEIHLRPIAADYLVRDRLARMITGSVRN